MNTGIPSVVAGGDHRSTDRAALSPGGRSGSSTGERLGPSTGASVMLDIGEGTGALMVYTSELLEGEEIEIRPHGGAWAGTHTAVRARHLGARVLHAGVFGSLPVGLYDLRVRALSSSGPDHPHHHGGGHHHDEGHRHHHGDHDDVAAPALTVGVEPGRVTETTLTEAAVST